VSTAAAQRQTMTPEELEAFLENLPRPLRDLNLLRDIHLMDMAHKNQRQSGTLTLIVNWDTKGDPAVVSAQPGPVRYELTRAPEKAHSSSSEYP
jgi:hypothetical protein